MQIKNNNLGITLIALVVTIIVLLILSGITIGILNGDNNIIKNATEAKELEERNNLEEQIDIAITKAEQKYRNPTLEEVINEIIEKKIIDETSQVDKNGVIHTNDGYDIPGKLEDYYKKEEVEKPEVKTYTVKYIDGTPDGNVFPDEVVKGLKDGDLTPDFKGEDGKTEIVDGEVQPIRQGFMFMGWEPFINPKISEEGANEDGEIVYKATWMRK